jgi:motility quorum-sensing regulator/GCU-specific mRNA interferase toxin
MEKRTPHCKLSVVKAMIEGGKVRIILSALTGGAALGFDADGIVGVVMALTTKDFHKSMTTHADHRIWQDVYRSRTSAGEVYLKLTVIDEVLIVSFKEISS